MTEEVVSCRPDDPLETAVRIMRDHRCGCVPVVDERMHVVGLVTDRDAVMCALEALLSLRDLRVGDACSRDVICCQAEDTLERAEVLMRVNHVRRLPVTGPDRELMGILSLTDLARFVEFSAGSEWTGLSPRHIAVVLAETSGRRRGSASPAEAGTGEKMPQPIVERFFHG
jgi:CBS-domain-containing membrane protein